MPAILLPLFGFAIWTILLLVHTAAHNTIAFLTKREPPKDGDDDDLRWRAKRAHLNAIEGLPIMAALVVVLSAMGRVPPEWYTTLLTIVLGARVLQSTTHIISASRLAVSIRFTFFLVQVGGYVIVVIDLAQRFLID